MSAETLHVTTAPSIPTTETLHASYPSSHEDIVREHRNQIIETVTASCGSLAIVGPCSLSGERTTHLQDARMAHELGKDAAPGVLTIFRGPFWKPRSNPVDWHGHETTDPEGAYSLVHSISQLLPYTSEVRHPYHLSRYGHLLSMAWIGSRTVGDETIREALVADQKLHNLPVGVKNGMDGTIEEALRAIDTINIARGTMGAFLIFRGGESARTPETWMQAYQEAHTITNGRLVVDIAHGSEMAHDPTRQYRKSTAGQLQCLEALNRVMNEYRPLGIMAEASSAPSPTDPVIPIGTTGRILRVLQG